MEIINYLRRELASWRIKLGLCVLSSKISAHLTLTTSDKSLIASSDQYYASMLQNPIRSLRVCIRFCRLTRLQGYFTFPASQNLQNSVNFSLISIYIHENPFIKCNTIIIENYSPKGIAQSLQDFWQGYEGERWNRLHTEPLWIFCDIFAVFSWEPVLGELSSELKIAELGAFQQASRVEHTHSVHRFQLSFPRQSVSKMLS
ncbi:hypothetical protein BDD12DRAFT_28644 [Trichophaea hybrida]|nr:hypothetical protein BDD12DRAFT_28644 [Trichophaea hybrida]